MQANEKDKKERRTLLFGGTQQANSNIVKNLIKSF